MKRIIDAMIQIEPGAMDSQKPVWVPDIRKLAGIPHTEFNRLILEMSLASGIIRLKKYPYPAQLSKQEKSEMVFDGEHFYSGVIIRVDAAEKIAALDEPGSDEPLAETVPDNPMPVEPVTIQADQAEQEPLPIKQPKPKGGKRAGAGRPKGIKLVNDDMLKMPVCIRLPRWMLNWLTDRGNVGSTIEQALIEVHKLTPPAVPDRS